MRFDEIDAAVEELERIVHPEGRCAVCGGGKPYWRHFEQHAFTPTNICPYCGKIRAEAHAYINGEEVACPALAGFPEELRGQK